MMVQTYLRRGKRSLQRLLLDPRVRGAGAVALYGGSGFFLSAARLGGMAQPLAAGLICASTGWRALVMSLGAMLGYPAFWGREGRQGMVWAACVGLLALLAGKRPESREQPLMIPVLSAFLVAVTGLSFFFLAGEASAPAAVPLRAAVMFFSGVLFTQFLRCRDPVTDWITASVGVLALAGVMLGDHIRLGCVLAGVAAVGSSFPAAALAGLGLDLARVTPLPMTAVLCLAYFLGMIPFARRWKHYAAPGFACALVCAVWNFWDLSCLPGLAVGGALGAVLPLKPPLTRRRGESGAAQVRLELASSVLLSFREQLLEQEMPPVDREALMEQVYQRACAGCPKRAGCPQSGQLHPKLMDSPLEADCGCTQRLLPELNRARRQLKQLLAQRARQQECRLALAQQYRFLGLYLRSLCDTLPRGVREKRALFSVHAAARSRGKEGLSGDRCLAFSAGACRYYVVLCDGMGTGPGAAREGVRAAKSLEKMLLAGFPAEHALESWNSLLALEGSAGSVTVDLAEILLDRGHVHLYKWGAAPSLLLGRGTVEKIGTAAAPPGLSVRNSRAQMRKLSLRRGEVLILLSDGVDGEDCLHPGDLSADLPPGELAANILDRGGNREDDATAAAIRLTPLDPPVS